MGSQAHGEGNPNAVIACCVSAVTVLSLLCIPVVIALLTADAVAETIFFQTPDSGKVYICKHTLMYTGATTSCSRTASFVSDAMACINQPISSPTMPCIVSPQQWTHKNVVCTSILTDRFGWPVCCMHSYKHIYLHAHDTFDILSRMPMSHVLRL